MSDSEPWTIGRLLTWTTDYLRQHGADSPRLDTEVLLASACGCERIDLYATFHELPDEAARGKFREFVRRRAEGTPVAYLVGHKEFYSLNFHVTPAVLIPRPETELLVATVLDLIKQSPPRETIQIADVGTGSGIIAICLAKYASSCHVTACDVSQPALEVAKRNVRDYQLEKSVDLVQSDLLAGAADREFDYVVSNPPYVDEQDMAGLADEFRHEPTLGLASGRDGLDSVTTILHDASRFLDNDGVLLVEVGNSQFALQQKYPTVDFVWLDFAYGGDGVFLLTREQLLYHQAQLS